MGAIRGVVLDFGGVLAMPPSSDALARLHTISDFGDADAFLNSWRRHRLPYDLGQISAHEYWRLVGTEGEREYDQAILGRLLAEDAACWAVQNTALVVWLEALKAAGLRLALLSNMPREQWETLEDGLAWLSLCDVVILSYELRIAKPDPDVYRRCLDRLSLAPSEVLFVDDSPDNVEAAATLGMNAVLFTTLEELRRTLATRFDGIPLPADAQPMPFDLVIFDCDGVLVDSERLAVKVDVQVFGALGLSMTEEEVIERFVGRSEDYIVSQIEAALGRPLAADWEEEFIPLYREAFAAELRPVDGVVDALDQITLPTCVASSGSHEKMRYTLGLTGLYDRFAGRIFSVSEVARGKPAPDLFLHAARQMGVDPGRCAVVEDSRWGVEAARAAGMRAFGYAGGVTRRERLEGPGTMVFEDMRELPRLLAGEDLPS